MKLENLKLNITLKGNNDNSVNMVFEVGSLELTPQEHEAELRMMEKLIPFLNNALTELTVDMSKTKRKD